MTQSTRVFEPRDGLIYLFQLAKKYISKWLLQMQYLLVKVVFLYIFLIFYID